MGLSSAVTNGPLTALGNGTSPNGVYAYDGADGFPTNSGNGANYWVDVLFIPTPAPGAVSGVTATAAKAGATVTWTAPSSGGPPTSYVVTPYIGSTAQATTTVTGTPPATTANVRNLTPGTSYTFSVHATNANGSGPESGHTNAVTPTGATAPNAPTGVAAATAGGQAQVNWTDPTDDGGSSITGYKITPYLGSTAQTPVSVGRRQDHATVTGLTNGASYTFTVTAINGVGSTESAKSAAVTPAATLLDFGTPATIDGGDTSGRQPRREVHRVAVRPGHRHPLLQGEHQHGTHVGDLWSASGQLLASATFSNESASGWQSVQFSQPVSVTAGTTYVASYFAPNGHYSFTGSAFNSAVTNGPLTAPSNASSGGNGVYMYTGPERLPEQQLQRCELLGRRDVPADVDPGRSDQRDGHGRPGLDHGLVDGTDERWRPDVLHRHAVHRLGGPDADHGQRHAAGDDGHRQGAHPGHVLHVHRQGRQRQRQRSGVGALKRGHPAGRVRPDGTDERVGGAGRRPRLRSTGARPTTTAAARSPATP